MNKVRKDALGPADVTQRADDALRRALNTPPKPHKDMKKGKGKKRQDERPTASDDEKRER